jgi:hypothetical protein
VLSYDTSKPLKWALKGESFHEKMNLRGGGPLNHYGKMSPEDIQTALYNIAFLRRYA